MTIQFILTVSHNNPVKRIISEKYIIENLSKINFSVFC